MTFQDDLFIADKKRFFEFCDIRNSSFANLYWSCTGRANLCDEDIIQAARSSGCTDVSYGFESGSPRMLKSMQKHISLEQMENVVRLNRKYGLPVPVSFILGMPGEDKESCKETLDFCKKNNLTLDSLMYATPYPGTPLFDFAIDTGRIRKDEIHEFVMKLGDARDFSVNLTDHFSDTELQLTFSEMMREARMAYRPIPQEAMDRKIKSLYGDLADYYFNISPEDREHRDKHGAMDLF